jgi:hypothetical protein
MKPSSHPASHSPHTTKGAPSFARSSRKGWDGAIASPKSLAVAFTLALLLPAPSALAQDFGKPAEASKPASSPANSMVQYLFPEQITIPAQKSTEVALHFRVAEGLHINSHAPREKSLIATSLAIAETTALKVTAVEFPPGTDYAFAFAPSEKLSVYTGEFTVKARLTAPPGDYLLQGLLRYQACDSRSCYPPKTIPVALDVIAK